MKLIAVIFVTLLLIVTSETQVCTPIQECNVTINGNCYAHVDDNINWNQAEDCCVAWGGHLASIHSYDDNILLNGIRNRDRYTWIGLSDTANDSVYVWTDGTPFDYNNLATNQPNHIDGESCFYFNGTTSEEIPWGDYYCNSTSFGNGSTSYICQKRQFTSVCGNKVISGVSDTGGICYQESLTTDILDWNAATLICSNTNGSLARVLNEEMSNEIERVTQDTDEYWIGLNRSNSDSEFMWSDGSSLSYERWSNGHPMNGLNCVSVRGGSTEWYSRNCSDVKPYVCETDVCVGWIVRNGICYKRFDDEMNADEAVLLCEAENAYLAEIPNIYVDNIITEMVEDTNVREYWTGLRTNSTHYYWRIGGFPLGGDTLTEGNEMNRCGRVDGHNGNRWKLHQCTSNGAGAGTGADRRVICMIGPLMDEFPIERCENSSADTLVYEDSCYTRITVHEENLDRATLTCTDYYNGTLYTLDNTTVNTELSVKFGNGGGNNLRIVAPGEYSRFTPQVGFFNLYTTYNQMGYPKDPDCVRIDNVGMLSGSSSSSSNCPSGDNRDYICKRAKTTTTTPTTTAATTRTPPTISPPNHSNYSYSYPCENNVIDNIGSKGGICYTAFSSDIVNWSTADMKCGENGNSRLAKALVGRMSVGIERVISDTEEYWIGLSRSDSNSEFMWSDGSSLSYTRWSSSHPINELNCVSVFGDRNEWYSRDCNEVKPYVCETDVCGDWTVRNGICYKKFDSNTTWTDSVELCKNESAFLAEIPNIYINDRITELIPNTEECYIGLYEDSTGISWRIGEFPVTEPNSTSVATSTDIRYGTMHGSGRWSLGNGDTNKCAVCMRGNPTPETSYNYQCNRVTDNDVKNTVSNGICYRRLGATPSSLDIIAYRCQNFVNGELYTFDNLDLNEQLFQRFNTDTFIIQSRNQYSGYIPPENSFNLLATNETYNFSEYLCEIVSRDSVINPYTPQAGETCEDSSFIYFCKTDYTPSFYISNQITFNETLYQLITHNRDFNEAKSYCSNQKGNNDKNGHLMDILNQQQQQVLLDLTSTNNSYVDEYYWIGLKYNGSSYVWTSGVVANYIQNITIQTDTVSYCVAVDREGNWLGLDCSDKYSYICQRPDVTITTTLTTTTPTNVTTTTPTNVTTTTPTNMTTTTPTNMTLTTPTNMTSTTPRSMTPTKTSDPECSNNEDYPICMGITNARVDNSTDMAGDVLRRNENVVSGILKNIGIITLGERVRGFNEFIKANIIAVRVNSSENTNVTFEKVSVEINSDSFQENPTIVSAVYQDIVNFTRFEEVLSEVITIVASEELTGTLGIRFSILQNITANFSCNSLTQNGIWVTDGIVTTVIGNSVLCITSHLTSFAVLIDPTVTSTVDDDHRQYQAYISVVLCGLSLVALLTTIILYLCLGKKFYRKDINIIQLNFVIALSFALITFFLQTIPYFGMIEIPPQACGAITLLTHYCWLSVFSWNFCQALHIILALFGNKLPFKRHYLPLMLIGWGVPTPIVIVTLGVGLAQGAYQNADDVCFLTAQNGLIWAFLGPICFTLVINTCILIFIIIVSIYVQRRRRHKLAYSWRLVIGIATTIPLLGLPWIVGLLIRVIDNTSVAFIAINYIFIIVNASQGLIFFVVHVIRNQEIRSLCSSNLKADINIHPDDKEKKKERESIEGKLRGTEGTFSLRQDVMQTHLSSSIENNEIFQNTYT